MFFNFLIHFLHLDQNEVSYIYAPWYAGAGAIIGAVIPIITSLVFVLLFYYGWSKLKATNTFHWGLMGIVNMIAAFGLNLFVGKASLSNYIYEQGDEFQSLWYTINSWPFSTDLWIFAINGIIWSLIFYFVFSLLLKRWSPVYNIPFGKKYKKAIN